MFLSGRVRVNRATGLVGLILGWAGVRSDLLGLHRLDALQLSVRDYTDGGRDYRLNTGRD